MAIGTKKKERNNHQNLSQFLINLGGNGQPISGREREVEAEGGPPFNTPSKSIKFGLYFSSISPFPPRLITIWPPPKSKPKPNEFLPSSNST
jgi:hypothetical protein